MCFYTIGNIYLATFLLSFQPAKYRISNDINSDEDNENSDDSNVSTTEVRDIIEDTSSPKVSENNIEQFLNSEKTYTVTFQQEIVEPVCEKVTISKNIF